MQKAVEKEELEDFHARLLEAKRKIPVELSVAMGLVSRGRDSIAFAYRRNGKSEYTKVRTQRLNRDGTRERLFRIEPAGATLFPYNVDCLKEWSKRGHVLTIVEGEIDCLSLLAAGEVFCISVPNGANREKAGEGAIDPLSDGGFAWLWKGTKLHPDIDQFDKIILATDNDKPGQVLRDELAIRLGRQRCYGVEFPAGCKDANDVLVKHGESALQDVIQNAAPLVPDKLVSFKDLPELEEIVEYPVWPGMADNLRINIPEFMVVTGAPGSGKSTWALNLGCMLAEAYEMKGAILQFEDQPRRNYDDIVRFKLRNIKEPTQTDIGKAQLWAEGMFRTIAPTATLDDEEDYTFKWLRDAIWEAVKRHDVKWVIADPWGDIEHCWGVNESETRYTNEALRQLKRMARALDILLVVVVHPTKQAGQERDIALMSIYGASGSAAWRNKADHGIIIYRPEGSKETLVKVDKCKNHRTMGVPGIVRMVYDQKASEFLFAGKYVALIG